MPFALNYSVWFDTSEQSMEICHRHVAPEHVSGYRVPVVTARLAPNPDEIVEDFQGENWAIRRLSPTYGSVARNNRDTWPLARSS